MNLTNFTENIQTQKGAMLNQHAVEKISLSQIKPELISGKCVAKQLRSITIQQKTYIMQVVHAVNTPTSLSL